MRERTQTTKRVAMMRFEPTAEQKAIIEADLTSMAIVACPGSGKTATAVRRLAELRNRFSEARSRVALLSFSNVAVDTFRAEYQNLQGSTANDNQVVIQTVDSFITNYILKPHGARVMKAERMPFLCLGDEPFLSAYKFGDKEYTTGVANILLNWENGRTILYRKIGQSAPAIIEDAMRKVALEKLRAFAATGAYTHSHGRAWSRLILSREPDIAKALALRFPQILVDEAQDIGTYEGEILNLLIQAGSCVSLIGDYHQSIYGFNFATGDYLRSFSKRASVASLPLTQNRRSLPAIIEVANALARTESKPHRTSSQLYSGVFYWRYEEEKCQDLVTSWASALRAKGYALSDAAVLCRSSRMLSKFSSASVELGTSAVKHLASAALERDRTGDIVKTFNHCVQAAIHLIDVPRNFAQHVKSPERGSDLAQLRRLLWDFIQNNTSGIPSAMLPARSKWLPTLKANLAAWLDLVEEKTEFRRAETWTARVTAKDLPERGALLEENFGQNDLSGLRLGTVHSAKGEGIPAVMYLMTNKHLTAMLAGTTTEEGRIGFVAVTRARDLLVVAIPKATSSSALRKLRNLGFRDWLHPED
jgi:superfamily I DNA/RNA helicase